MWAILLWILTSFLASSGTGFWKKAIIHSSLSTLVFNFLAAFLGIVAITTIYFIFWFNYELLEDYKNLSLIFLVVWINLLNTPLEIYINSNEKLSTLLPYSNLDRIFIILIGFILFFNTPQSTSILTLIITFVTILIYYCFQYSNMKNKIKQKYFTLHSQ